MVMSDARGVYIRGSCLAEASLLRRVASPAPSTAPNHGAGGDPLAVLVPGAAGLPSASARLDVTEGGFLPRV